MEWHCRSYWQSLHRPRRAARCRRGRDRARPAQRRPGRGDQPEPPGHEDPHRDLRTAAGRARGDRRTRQPCRAVQRVGARGRARRRRWLCLGARRRRRGRRRRRPGPCVVFGVAHDGCDRSVGLGCVCVSSLALLSAHPASLRGARSRQPCLPPRAPRRRRARAAADGAAPQWSVPGEDARRR